MSATVSKEYTKGEITVVWKPATCIHSEKCWRGLPGVFDPKGKPWIKIEGAPTQEIINQVDKCPSKALTWYRNEDGKPKREVSASAVRIEITNNGPILAHGSIEVTHSNGSKEKRDQVTALCRCGFSSNKPYCDGSHKRENWTE